MVVLRSEFESKKRRTITRTVSFKRSGLNESDESDGLDKIVTEEPIRSLRRKVAKNLKVETTMLFGNLVPGFQDHGVAKDLEDWLSPKPSSQVNAAATRLQKVYRSYRTRRNLADCAVVVEELWWKALDFAALRRSSVSFFDSRRSETVSSRWARAMTRAAKVGKGLSKYGKAQKLALRHWLEAIDPRHRYGHNLHLYYAKWFSSESYEPFFYWLDIGKGKEVTLEKCPRTILQHQCIKYLGPVEREAYEVIVENRKLLYKQSGALLKTTEGSKWIFVLSTSRKLYVAEKKKGVFQHSSFLAGGATIAAGRVVAHNGVLEGIWGYSGHYCPTEENFKDFISFLEEHQVDLTNVKKYAMDDDIPPINKIKMNSDCPTPSDISKVAIDQNVHLEAEDSPKHIGTTKVELPKLQLGKCLSGKWTSGAGPRISCVREYPTELQNQALEQINQSPKSRPNIPIPSPRPSPKVLLSPRVSYLGLQSPRLHSSALSKTHPVSLTLGEK